MCLISDLNHDGKPDMYEYYDKEGASSVVARPTTTPERHHRLHPRTYDGLGRLVRAASSIRPGSGASTPGSSTTRPASWFAASVTATNDGRIDQWAIFDASAPDHRLPTKDGDGQPDPVDAVVLNLDGTPVDDRARCRGARTPSLPVTPDASPRPPRPTLATPMDETRSTRAATGGKGKGTDGKQESRSGSDFEVARRPRRRLMTSKDGGT